MQLTHKILTTINRYGMLKKGDRVLVAVSGGPDSAFLLHVLNSLKNKIGVKLCIAHMDHGIRGAESRRDAEFVKKLARSLGLKIAYKKLGPGKTKSKLSLEERLRERRYGFFKKAAKKLKANVVATAHSLDDQAETVLMRVIKGASLKGVVGIHPVRTEGKLKFARPLFELEKKDILKFLKERKIPFRVDRTNAEDRFLRNKVRNKVLPYLAKLNPRIKRALFNLSESLREDFEFIEREKKVKKGIIKGEKNCLRIGLCDILLQPRALRKEIVREALGASGGNIKKLTYRHWKDIDEFIRAKQRGKSMDLPGGVRVLKTHDSLIFAK